MAKKLIRLTEGDLHRIVKESVRRILKERSGLEDAFSEVDFSDPDDRDAWDSISRDVNSKKELVYKIIDGIYDGDFDNEIANGIIWKKIREIIPDIDSFMYERLRNELDSAIKDQKAVADKDYAFRYGEEDHYDDDDYYEDEYGNMRNKFDDEVEWDLTHGEDVSSDPYDSKELSALRNNNVFDKRNFKYGKKGNEIKDAWREHRMGQIGR